MGTGASWSSRGWTKQLFLALALGLPAGCATGRLHLDQALMAEASGAGRHESVVASYTVANTTAAPTVISYKDGHGKTVTETINLVSPLVGQLQTDLPDTFTDVRTPRADLAGDGHGGTIAAFTLVLFGPIGAPTQAFGWRLSPPVCLAYMVRLAPVASSVHTIWAIPHGSMATIWKSARSRLPLMPYLQRPVGLSKPGFFRSR